MAMSARELLANLPLQLAKGGSANKKQLLAAEKKYLANPDKRTGAQLYNMMLEQGVDVNDLLNAGVKQSTIDQVFTAQGPVPMEQFTAPTTAKSSLAGLEAQERERAIARGTSLVNKLQQGGVDAEERRRLQRAATQYGVTFEDMIRAGIDPSILFDVQLKQTPKGPQDTTGITGTVYTPGAVDPRGPAIDQAFRDSPVRERIPGVPEFDPLTGSPTGYRYTPAARLTPATGSGLSWTPPVVTSRPRQLLDVGGGYQQSYSQRYAAGRSEQDRALMEAFEKSGRFKNNPNSNAEYNYWRNRLRANEFGGVQDTPLDKEGFNAAFNTWNESTSAPSGSPTKSSDQNIVAGTNQYPYNFYSNDYGSLPSYLGGNNAELAGQDPTGYLSRMPSPTPITVGGAMMFNDGGLVKKPEGVGDESATPETESAQMLNRITAGSSPTADYPLTEEGTADWSQRQSPASQFLSWLTTGGERQARYLTENQNKSPIWDVPATIVKDDKREQAKAMLRGLQEIPGTVANYATETIQGDEPLKTFSQDVGTVGRAMYEGAKEDPIGFALDMTPGIAQYRAVKDASNMAQMAIEAEAAGDFEAAKMYREMSALSMSGAIPGIPGKRASKSAKMLDNFDQINTKPKSQVEARRRTKTGQYIGAPEGTDTPQKLASIVKSMKNLAKKGEYGRFWYERSGRQILDLVGGDVDAADKIIQAVAITSPQTPVANNFEYALQAYNQWRNGEPIKTGTYTGAMSKKLQDMFDAAPEEDVYGIKTGNFYKNLMVAVDPSRVQGATIDIWMMRAFGYKGDVPTPAQYKFAENEIKRIANDLNWEPQQVQAAVWVDLKARMENPGIKKAVEAESTAKGWMHYEEVNGKNVRVLDDPEKHRNLWLQKALAYTPTEADKAGAKFDYADAAQKNLAQISWESIPGRTNTHMPEIFDAPYEVINDYHVAISKAFLDDQGRDIVAQRIGIMSPGDFEAPGYFEGRVSPGTQTEVVAPRQFGITAREDAIRAQAKAENWSKEKLAREVGLVQGAMEPAANDQIAVYAAVRGILMKQDGVGYHRPQYVAKLSAPRANGVQIDIGRPLTPNETSAFAEALSKYAGHGEYNPIGDPMGARIINFDYLETPNTDFQKVVNKALSDIEFEGGESFNARRFTGDTGYLGNNWKEKVNGEGYLDDGRLAGRPDLQQVVRDIVTELEPRIEAVETEFANKYGWTRNLELNSAYRKGEEVGSAISVSAEADSGRKGTGQKLPEPVPDRSGNLGDAKKKAEARAEEITALNKSGEPLGINIAVDKNGTDYADLIVSGTKKFESRETASLKPYVGKRVGIVRTGAGPAEVIGSVEIGQPIEVNEKQFNQLRDQHLVAEDSSFNIKKGQTKFLYPMMNPIPTPAQKVTSKGIVARAVPPAIPDRSGKGSKVTYEQFGGSLGDAKQKLGITDDQVTAYRSANKGVAQKRIPEVQVAAKKLKSGEMTTQEYLKTIEDKMPITPIGEVPKRASVEDIAMSLKKNDIKSGGIVGVNLDVPDGTMISSRLDIPAYEGYDTWVVTLHDGTIKNGNAIGYGQTAVLDNVTFQSNAKAALNMATGDTSKGTIARMNGAWKNMDPAEVEQMAKSILDGTAPDASDWVEVGMNPFRHSYFYRKADGMPVADAEQVIQVGPLVLAKKPKTRPIESPEHLIDPGPPPRHFKRGGNVERVYNERRYI
jgi:hypothetical protein